MLLEEFLVIIKITEKKIIYVNYCKKEIDNLLKIKKLKKN